MFEHFTTEKLDNVDRALIISIKKYMEKPSVDNANTVNSSWFRLTQAKRIAVQEEVMSLLPDEWAMVIRTFGGVIDEWLVGGG